MLRPSRLVSSIFVLAALGTAAWLLMLVVSQNAVHTPGPSATKSQTSSPPAAQSNLASGQPIHSTQAPFGSQASDRDQEIKGVMP